MGKNRLLFFGNAKKQNDMFYRMISGVFPMDVHKMIENHSSMLLYYTYDLLENIGDIIVSDNGEILLKLKAPQLPYCSGSGPTVAQRTASNQQQIDMWLKLLAENLEYKANSYRLKQLDVQIRYSLTYKSRMYWVSGDINENCVYIHPYVKKYYPDDYEEIKSLKEQEGYIVSVDIFEDVQRNQFERWGIDYLRLKEEEI
ncbi:hypothetical protein IMSAG249_00582 [Lachnospiraceae bacterium]|nr:hypothetical protein IMSAG249_00582 [Lachnospiraceae bacterium]